MPGRSTSADTSGVRLKPSHALIRRPDVQDQDATGRFVKRTPSKYWLLVALLFTSCSPIRELVGTTFDLAADSRLPGWFAVPAGATRADVRVTLTYYPPLLPSDSVLELRDSNGRALASARGPHCWHPASWRPAWNARSAEYVAPDLNDPKYIIVTVSGVTEVLIHRYSSTFRVIDDATLIAQAKESLAKGECRKAP
jgi:hypothetical protein